MPMHDWTRVNAGTFHYFHTAWITHIVEALNGGLLPDGYYALGEQVARDVGPDVLAFHVPVSAVPGHAGTPAGAVTVAEAPPRVSISTTLDREAILYARRRQTVVIRHVSGHEIVALIEIISPGNRSSQHELDELLDKLVGAINQGYHLLVIDLFPPTRVAPAGIHGAMLDALGGGLYEPPPNRPFTLAAYVAGLTPRTYVEPIRVGSVLCDMPLFLSADWYVNLPLEKTYETAWTGMPVFWKAVLEGRAEPPRRN
jgi:hypothetical protein